MEIKSPPVVAISRTATSPIVGMGMLLDPHHVVTCAHVVNFALGRDHSNQTLPTDTVCVRFVFATSETSVTAEVTTWAPPNDGHVKQDLALLTLSQPANQAVDQPRFAFPRIDEPVRAFGIPGGSKLGSWWRGAISLPVIGNWLQLDHVDPSGPYLEPGFSGTPLLSLNGRRTYGILARVRERVGYMIPSQHIETVCCVPKHGDTEQMPDSSFDNHSQPAYANTSVLITDIAVDQRGSLFEVIVDADELSFSDDDALYLQRLIHYLRDHSDVRITVSYIRRGSTIVGFHVSGEEAETVAADIVEAINAGDLPTSGMRIIGARLGTFSPEMQSPEAIEISRYFRFKPFIECAVASVLLVVLAPLITVLAIVVKLTSRGSAFFVQSRLGKNGRIFKIIKLRTMVTNAEKETGPVWSGRDDPRVTRFGRFLRNNGWDELPQLLNVVRGDMAIVGPRPERPEIAAAIERRVVGFEKRVGVRPGIMSFHSGPPAFDADIAGIERRLRDDLFYMRNASLFLDAKTVVKAVIVKYFVAIVSAFAPARRYQPPRR